MAFFTKPLRQFSGQLTSARPRAYVCVERGKVRRFNFRARGMHTGPRCAYVWDVYKSMGAEREMSMFRYWAAVMGAGAFCRSVKTTKLLRYRYRRKGEEVMGQSAGGVGLPGRSGIYAILLLYMRHFFCILGKAIQGV